VALTAAERWDNAIAFLLRSDEAAIRRLTRRDLLGERYPILREIRELSTTSALLRNGHSDTAARRELQIRIRSLRTGDDHRWTAF
jgi:hypothetical protein